MGPGRGRRAVRAPGSSMPTPPELGHRGALQGAKPVTLRSAAPSEDSQGLLNGSVLRTPWNSSALQLCPVLCPLSSPISLCLKHISAQEMHLPVTHGRLALCSHRSHDCQLQVAKPGGLYLVSLRIQKSSALFC